MHQTAARRELHKERKRGGKRKSGNYVSEYLPIVIIALMRWSVLFPSIVLSLPLSPLLPFSPSLSRGTTWDAEVRTKQSVSFVVNVRKPAPGNGATAAAVRGERYQGQQRQQQEEIVPPKGGEQRRPLSRVLAS